MINLLIFEVELMIEKQIRIPSGQLIGRITDVGNRIEVRRTDGVLLGWYCKASDNTRLANGHLYCWGNGVQMLL